MISFVNIWDDKILDTIRTFLNTEFAGSIPVYTGEFKEGMKHGRGEWKNVEIKPNKSFLNKCKVFKL